MIRILAMVATLCGYLGAAHAQDQSEAVIFPQLGHSLFVASVAFSPDGKLLASGSYDNTIKLWDVASGRELRTLTGHTDSINTVAFSPDGKVLASAGVDRGIKLWEVASGRELRTLTGHTDIVQAVAISPDGKLLASGSRDRTVKLWDMASGRELRTLRKHKNEVWSVAFSPDGKLLASGSRDRTVKLWEVASGRELRTLTGHADTVWSVAFAPDGAVLASGSADGSVKLWEVGSGRALLSMTGHKGPITSVAFSPDGKVIASGSLDSTIKFWDIASGGELRTLTGHASGVASVAFSPDGKVLASGSLDHTIKLWNLATGLDFRTLSGHANWVNGIAYSPDGKLLAAAAGIVVVSDNANGRSSVVSGRDNTITLWDVATGRALRILHGHNGSVSSVDFSPDGKLLASASDDNTVRLWDVASGRALRILRGHSDWVFSAAFSPDGKLLASAGQDKTIKLWNVADGTELSSLTGHTKSVLAVAFSPDGQLLASASEDKTIKLWDVASGRELRTLSGPSGAVWDIVFSPDGQLLASGSDDKTIRLWDVASGRVVRSWNQHTNWIFSVAFSPDGKLLASAGDNNTVELWDVASGQALRTLSGNTGVVLVVEFSPDGKMLASGGKDGTTREWDVASGKERVTLIDFTDGSFLAVTPEGYYDSSSVEAEEDLNVRVGDRVFGIGAFREKFYRPDLVRLGMAGTSLTRFGSIGGDKPPPLVELVDLPHTTDAPTLNLTLRLTDGGGGIGLVRVFLNGSAVIQDDRVNGPPTRSYAVPLLDGANELRAVAFNADGSVQSGSVAATVAAHLPRAPRGTLHAVIVGIGDFPNWPQHNLGYAVADARLFADTLKQYATPLFEKLDFRLLTTAAETDKDHVVAALTAMQSTAGADDEFVFYVASHGLVVDGDYYLVTANVGSAAAASLPAEAISRRQLAGLLANVHAPKKLVIIDTCHAQPVGDALQQAIESGGMSDSTATTILSRQIGSTVLAAAITDQQALEGYQDHGLFTRVIADGLGGKAAANGIVSNFSLADYVGAAVPPLAASVYQQEQTPTVSANGQRFPIAEIR